MYILNVKFNNVVINYTAKQNDLVLINIPKKSTSAIKGTEYRTTFFLTTKKYIPDTKIVNVGNVKVVYNQDIELKSYSTNKLVFTTTDGGSTWYVDFEVSNLEYVRSINGDNSPYIIIDGNKIQLNDTGPIIVQEVKDIKKQINDLEGTVVSDITGEVIKNLPDMIRIKIDDTEIIAEKI